MTPWANDDKFHSHFSIYHAPTGATAVMGDASDFKSMKEFSDAVDDYLDEKLIDDGLKDLKSGDFI